MTVMADDNKKNEQNSDTANIRQTNKQQDDQGEINLGGREFSGNGTDIESTSSGLPTMDPHETYQLNKNLRRSRKS